MIYLPKRRLILPGDEDYTPPGVCSLIGRRGMMAAAGGGGGPDVTLDFQAVQKDADNLSEYTFNGSAIGAETNGGVARTVVVLGVVSREYSSGVGVSGITVNTNAMTPAVEGIGSGGTANEVGLWYIDESDVEGTTDDIVVSMNGTANMMAIAVWALYGSAFAPTDTAADAAANPLTSSVNLPAGGAGIFMLIDDTAGNVTTYAWSDNASNIITEDFDENMGTANPITAGGSVVSATEVNPYNVTADPDNAPAEHRMVGATWAKA